MGLVSDFLKDQAGKFVDQGINKLLGGGAAAAGSGFNVDKMRSALSQSGLAHSSHFEVYIFGGGSGEREMAMRVDTIDLPGRNFAPIDHKFTNIGPVNRIPGQQFYSDVTATIILSEDLREKEYFEMWQEKMVNTGAFEAPKPAVDQGSEDNMDDFENTGIAAVNPYSGDYSYSPWSHKYFDNYIGRVEIRQYGLGGDVKSIHTLQEAYPLSIAPIGMSWASEEPAKLQVTFGYKNYKAVFNRANQPGMGFGFSFNLGAGGLKLGARIPGIGNIGYAKGAGITGDFGGITKKIFG